MYAWKQQLIIPPSRRIVLELPDDAPEGPAEIIVLCPQPAPPRPEPPREAGLSPTFEDLSEQEWEEVERAIHEGRNPAKLGRV